MDAHLFNLFLQRYNITEQKNKEVLIKNILKICSRVSRVTLSCRKIWPSFARKRLINCIYFNRMHFLAKMPTNILRFALSGNYWAILHAMQYRSYAKQPYFATSRANNV